MAKTTQGLNPSLIPLMFIATGLAVTSNYYAQPLLDTIARNFSLSASTAGLIVTAAQLGHVAGLLFLVPLGDMFERRMLIISMTLFAAGGVLITASSQSLGMLILGTVPTRLFSVVVQILVPLVATLATPDKRGKAVGTIMSGLLLDIPLAYTVVGLPANLSGWRIVFWVALVLMALMAVALWRGLPKTKPDIHLNYPQLLGSVFSLFIHDKLLCTRATLGCLTSVNFSILRVSTALLFAVSPFNYSEGMIGLFGLVGAAGALGVRPVDSFADRGKSHPTTAIGPLLLLLPWLVIWFGHASVPMLTIGILVPDLTIQGVHITNQTVIYRIHPDVRNRLIAGYTTSCLIGGVAGSLISASTWQHAGWAGACLVDTTVTVLNLVVWW